MKEPTRLKMIILRREISQRKLSELSEIDECRISLIVNGRYIPTTQQEFKIALALGLDREQLFEQS